MKHTYKSGILAVLFSAAVTSSLVFAADTDSKPPEDFKAKYEQAMGQVTGLQQRVDYLQVLAERNEYAFRFANQQNAEFQRLYNDLKVKADALEKELNAIKHPPVAVATETTEAKK